MSTSFEDEFARQIVAGLSLSEGMLIVPEELMAALGQRIRLAGDKQPLASALIALVTRLKHLPGSQRATPQLIALAACALGDAPLNRVFDLGDEPFERLEKVRRRP